MLQNVCYFCRYHQIFIFFWSCIWNGWKEELCLTMSTLHEITLREAWRKCDFLHSHRALLYLVLIGEESVFLSQFEGHLLISGYAVEFSECMKRRSWTATWLLWHLLILLLLSLSQHWMHMWLFLWMGACSSMGIEGDKGHCLFHTEESPPIEYPVQI